MRWRFAAHLGVRAPDQPLLAYSAASTDPLDQIAAISDAGLAGAFDNFLMLRTPDVQSRIGAALADRGMTFGSFVYDPLRWNCPDWSTGHALGTIDLALDAARRDGSRTINCVTGADPGRDRAPQLAGMRDTLCRAADRTGTHGIALCVETTHPDFAPGALIDCYDDAVALVRAADHPWVRLNLDIGHLALAGLDPVAAIGDAAGLVGMVQVADVPARVEPGAGTLDWDAIGVALNAAGHFGITELECEPALPGQAGERAMLARLAHLSTTE